MLGSRTKQINAYGRRSKRIVSDATDRPTVPTSDIISIFDDSPLPPPPQRIASKMRKRENAAPIKPKDSLTKVVGLQKKRRLSPVLSPIKKKPLPRTLKIVETDSPKLNIPFERSQKPKVVVKTLSDGARSNANPASPPRAPLSTYPINIPGSPAISQKFRKHRIPSSKLQKPFSPFVDVDIIVLDDEGQTVLKEKRVTRSGVDGRPSTKGASAHPISITTEDSDGEVIGQPRRPKRSAARKQPIIISDDSDSDEDYVPETTQPVDKVKETWMPKLSAPKPKMIVEVVVPPAPYKIANMKSTWPSASTPSVEELDALPEPEHYAINTSSEPSYIDSPIAKARQLTPFRGGGRKRLFVPPSPPSPTTPTDLDFSFDFSSLDLGTLQQTQTQGSGVSEAPEYLKGLLEECHQESCGPHNFSAFIDSFPYDPILGAAREREDVDMSFRKIGEASYSEVFGIGDVVLKVIPLRDETQRTIYSSPSCQEEDEGPAPSDASDVRKEIIVTRAMGEVYGGFVRLMKAYVVRGRYPEVLLNLWDEYNERKGSESVRPDTFRVSQMYAIIVLPNGGPDLEAYTFQNPSKMGWRQACSLFWQVAKALAHAETLVSFEHRDLHWGQILVKDVPIQNHVLRSLSTNQKARTSRQRVFMDDLGHGVQATLIDLGLSRMDAGDGGTGNQIHWTPFDAEVFMGEGDYQFEVYRMMKELIGEDWRAFQPATNVLWLHYLLQKLILSKGLKAPRKSKTAIDAPVATINVAFTEKDCYDCLLDIEKWLSQSISDLIPARNGKSKGKRKAQLPPTKSNMIPACAGEIVAYAVKKGWVKASSIL